MIYNIIKYVILGRRMMNKKWEYYEKDEKTVNVRAGLHSKRVAFTPNKTQVTHTSAIKKAQ